MNFPRFSTGKVLGLAAALCLGCGLCLFLFVFRHPSITRLLQTIPAEERFSLEAFFRSLISRDNGAYLLFGDKPASLMLYNDWEKTPPTLDWDGFPTIFSRHKLGFAVWQKYQHLFPSKNYTIIKTQAFSSEHLKAIFLIHRQRLLNVLKQDFTEFQKVFPQFTSPESLWTSILHQGGYILGEICSKHNYLLGIILGFGKDNAALYARMVQIRGFVQPHIGYSYHCPHPPFFKPMPAPGFSSLEEEYAAIDALAGGVIDVDNDLGINWVLHFPMGFLIDVTKTDVVALRAKYKAERKKATQAYRDGHFLEITLQELMK